jgi:hypothetical protein
MERRLDFDFGAVCEMVIGEVTKEVRRYEFQGPNAQYLKLPTQRGTDSTGS